MMENRDPPTQWQPGTAPVAVVMITLNEVHQLEGRFENLKGFAHEIFVVDSYSSDHTVDICLRHGVQIVQRKFRGFGDQWNFALRELSIAAPWTLKLDPDERLSDNRFEMERLGHVPAEIPSHPGAPDPRVRQYD